MQLNRREKILVNSPLVIGLLSSSLVIGFAFHLIRDSMQLEANAWIGFVLAAVFLCIGVGVALLGYMISDRWKKAAAMIEKEEDNNV